MTSVPDLDISSSYDDNAPAATQKISGAQVDVDHTAIKTWANSVLLPALAKIIRDDDTLVDELVRLRNLHPEIIAAIASNNGWQPKVSVACASTANLTLSGEQTIDGVATSASRVLVKNQSAGAENGIYVTASGAWSRATDSDTEQELSYAFVGVTGGTANASTTWVVAGDTSDLTPLGTASVTWAQVGGTVGPLPVNKGGTGSSTAAGARTNLGVRPATDISAAMQPVTSAATVDEAVEELGLYKTLNVVNFGAATYKSAAENDAAFQDALDALRDLPNGGKLTIPHGRYVLSAPITLQANAEMDDRPWIISGNGATLDWSDSGLTTGTLLTVGATANNFTYREACFTKLKDLRIIGPETQNCYVAGGGPAFPTADTDVSGLNLNSSLDTELENIFIRRCYIGLKANRCWPINARSVNISGCYVGLLFGSYCTLGTWVGCSVQAAAYCLVAQPDAIDEAIGSQTFIGLRLENSLRGITLDQRDSTSGTSPQIQGFTFINPRFEAIAYDLVRMGQAWEYANVSIAGAERNAAYCQAINFYGGEWQDRVTSGYSIRSSNNGYVRGCDINIPTGLLANINGTIALSKISIQPGLAGGTDSGKSYFPQGVPAIFGDEIQFNTTAGKIDFQGITSSSVGTTIASRKMGDYETGTWQPNLTPETNSFTSVTYDALTAGKYTRIGNLVFVTGTIRTDAITVGTATGGARIGGLPYTSAAGTFSGSISLSNGFATNKNPITCWVRTGSRLLSLGYRTAIGVPDSVLQVSDLVTTADANEISFSAVYIAA